MLGPVQTLVLLGCFTGAKLTSKLELTLTFVPRTRAPRCCFSVERVYHSRTRHTRRTHPGTIRQEPQTLKPQSLLAARKGFPSTPLRLLPLYPSPRLGISAAGGLESLLQFSAPQTVVPTFCSVPGQGEGDPSSSLCVVTPPGARAFRRGVPRAHTAEYWVRWTWQRHRLSTGKLTWFHLILTP